MCMFSTPKPPTPPPPPPPPPEPPKVADKAVQMARDDEKKRAAAAQGVGSTIATSGSGLSAPASTTQKTLLGQ